MSKKVAVILVNYNTTFHTMNCIASLYQYCDRALFDVILLDNGSVESPADIVSAKYPDVKFIDNGANLGFAEGNNVGLRYSTAKEYRYSLAVNTDTEVDEDIIKKLSDHLDANPAAAAVQPAVHWMHDRKAIWNGNGHFNKFTGRTWSNTSPVKLQAGHTYVKADWLTGCCMMMRNEALSTTGLFDKEMFLYYEDVDLSFRMRKDGYELHYLPSCKMYHEAGISAKAIKVRGEGTLNPVIHYYIARNHIWILRRYGSKLFYPVYFIYNGVYYVGVLSYLLIRRRNNKSKKLIQGLKEGMFAELSASQVSM